ncbi:MAG: RNA polymerase sporulation sigma factor SigK [Clostridia bacterium]
MFSIIASTLSCMVFLFGYISTNNLFPKALSKSEEDYYLKKYFEGSKEAKNILIEHNLRLVAHVAKKYSNGNQELEDYISIGSIGLIKAINSFKEDKGYKLSTYAAKCIENEILMNLRSTKKNQLEISLNNVIGTDKDGNDMQLEDIVDINEVDAIDTIYNKHTLNQLINYIENSLEPRESNIMKLRFGIKTNSHTQQEVADILGISRSYVSRIETKVQKKLSKIIKYEE